MSQHTGSSLTVAELLCARLLATSRLFMPMLPTTGTSERARRRPLRHALVTTSMLFILVALAQAVASMAAEPQSKASSRLAPVRHVANDPNLGSYLLHNPAQRSAFGIPTEALWATEEIDPEVFAEFRNTLLSKIIRKPIELAVKKSVPVEFETAEMSSEALENARALLDTPYDRLAQARVLATGLRLWAGLTEAAVAGLVLPLVADTIDRSAKLAELARSHALQKQARDLVRMPLGTQTGAASVLRQRIGQHSGSFSVQGQGITAQGGWRLDLHPGSHSVAYARYDIKNKYLADGTRISTLGEPPSLLPLKDAEAEHNPLDGILNWIGHNSNWIGRNVTGGDANNYQLDEWGQFTLGSTTVAGMTLFDKYARLHDIEYYVSTHFPPGTEVRVESPDGGYEYFTSEGDPTQPNLRVIGKVVAASTPAGLLNALITRDYEGRRHSKTGQAVDIGDRSRMIAPTHTINREKQLSTAPGGVFSHVEVHMSDKGVRVQRTQHSSYHVSYNGAAVSAAVEEYERTGYYDIDKHYRREETKRQRRADGAPPSGGGGSTGGGSGDGGGGSGGGCCGPSPDLKANSFGGISLKPMNVYSLDRSGLSEVVAERAVGAVSHGTEQTTAIIEVNGEKLVVARPSRRRSPTVADRPRIGRFRFYQTDLSSHDPDGPVLRRYFDSSATPSWSFVPFALHLSEQNATLIDREADVWSVYSRTSDGRFRATSGEIGRPALRSVSGGWRADFANGYTAMFDADGRLAWAGRDERHPVVYQYDDRVAHRLVRIARGSDWIAIAYDKTGRLSRAHTASGHAVDYRTGPSGAIERVVDPSGAQLIFTNDERGRAISLHTEPASGLGFVNQYDPQGRVVQHASGSRSWAMTYNSLSAATQRVAIRGGNGASTLMYFDVQDRLAAFGSNVGAMTLIAYTIMGGVAEVARVAIVGGSGPNDDPKFQMCEVY